jgi:uncharacterized lipoprotein
MSNRIVNGRTGLVLVLGAMILASSGCSLFRSKTGYELSPESRPLEVPPELSAPSSDGAMSIPKVGNAQRAATSGAFTLEDSPTGAFGRVGIALERIEGVSIKERSQLLTVYTVDYKGEQVLIRIAPHGDGARVSAANTEGKEVVSGAGATLLATLQQRLK